MSEFYTFLTDTGKRLLSKSFNANGVVLSKLGLSSYTGKLSPNHTRLDGEFSKIDITDIIKQEQDSLIILETILPSSLADISINSIGVYTSDDELFALARTPLITTQGRNSGATSEIRIKIYLAITSKAILNISLVNEASVSPQKLANSISLAKDELKGQLESLKNELKADITNIDTMPTGSIIALAAGNPPTGFLLCDGSAVSRSAYEKLFETIGTTYGSGDGSTTFNLPDFRGRFLRGIGDSAASLGVAQNDEFKQHSHRISLPRNDGDISTYFNGRINSTAVNYTLAPDSAINNNSFAYYDSSYTKEGGSETRPKNYAIYWLIKY